jgi:cation:H+ antiporter
LDLQFLTLALGIAGLLVGTELTIGGALAIARRHHLSEFFVGLIVLSIGSDLPEIAVAIDAGIKTMQGQDASGVVVGSAIGSVIAQIGFVLGVAGLLSFMTLPRRFIFRHGTVLLAATVVLFLLAMDQTISRVDGLILVALYTVYLVILLSRERVPPETPTAASEDIGRPWVRLILGLALVGYCSEVTVSAVVHLAREFDVSDAVISVLVIGLGTSLPELSISLAAIIKKRVHLSVGNIIGSNIFDTLVPISAAALIAPVGFASDMLRDLVYAFVLTAVVLYLFARRQGLQKPQAAVILALYIGYVIWKLTQL